MLVLSANIIIISYPAAVHVLALKLSLQPTLDRSDRKRLRSSLHLDLSLTNSSSYWVLCRDLAS